MTIEKCPCENCLVLVMCKGRKISNLIPSCDKLLYYVRNMSCAKEAIEIIVPPYYSATPRKKGVLTDNAHQIVVKADKMLHNRNKSYKRRIWHNE